MHAIGIDHHMVLENEHKFKNMYQYFAAILV